MMKRLLLAFMLLCCAVVPVPVSSAELSVFAASSLTGALSEIAQQYAQEHPADRVMLNLAGSQTLAMQIEQGAPADLFISANQAVMDRLQENDLVYKRTIILGNRLVVALHPDLQPQPTDLEEMVQAAPLLLIGNAQVPVGRYTRQLFDALRKDQRYGIELVNALREQVAGEESNVKVIVAKLLIGEADAGIVYRSDLIGSQLQALPLPDAHNPKALYPLAKVSGGSTQADTFYSFLQSSSAGEIFRRHGFLTGGEL